MISEPNTQMSEAQQSVTITTMVVVGPTCSVDSKRSSIVVMVSPVTHLERGLLMLDSVPWSPTTMDEAQIR